MDYFAYPVWERTPGASGGSVDPGSLPISDELRNQLAQCADEYEATDGAVQSTIGWTERGAELARRMQHELGEGYSITYQY